MNVGQTVLLCRLSLSTVVIIKIPVTLLEQEPGGWRCKLDRSNLHLFEVCTLTGQRLNLTLEEVVSSRDLEQVVSENDTTWFQEV